MEFNDLNREGDINLTNCRNDWISRLDKNIADRIMADERIYYRQSMSTPCLNAVVDAEGCYITDMTGKKYLDFHGNSIHQVGYKNQSVINAIKNQMDTLPYIPRRYTSDVVIRAAEVLNEKTLSKNFKVLFTPSGSAACGLALKIARKVTGKHKIISMWESFHGAGLDTIAVGGEYVFKKDMGPMMPGAIKAIPYNAYRNLLGTSDPERMADFCLDYLEYIIANEGDIGAIILEPIRATDTHIPPRRYFERLAGICNSHEIVLIFDEIPTAFGRSGAFYTHQIFGIEPDILVLGKGIGGGVIPQAAVLVKKEYDCAPDISLGHYTHEKPALGAAALLATIDYIDENRLLGRCCELSGYVREKAASLADKYQCIGDVRICGLLITFEMIEDRATKKKADQLAEKILYFCLNQGLSFKISAGNCITWHPPLIVSKEELKNAFRIFEQAMFL